MSKMFASVKEISSVRGTSEWSNFDDYVESLEEAIQTVKDLTYLPCKGHEIESETEASVFFHGVNDEGETETLVVYVYAWIPEEPDEPDTSWLDLVN